MHYPRWTWVLAWIVVPLFAARAAPAPPAWASGHVLIQFNQAARNEVAGGRAPQVLSALLARLPLPAGASLEEPPLRRMLREREVAAGRKPQSEAGVDLDHFLYLRLPPGLTVEACLARLREHRLVEYVEPDGIGYGHMVLPNDSSFSSQWHHRNTAKPGADIRTPDAWALTTGSANVTVAVLDTGLSLGSQEFAGRIVPGHDFVNNDEDPSDDHGHGTAVAGTLGATGNNGFLVAGVDWQCRVMPIKVLGRDNTGLYSWWAQGVDFALSHGAKVINLSAGGSSSSSTLTRAITNAIAQGVIVVVSAGNDDGPVEFPARLDEVICVAATDSSDRKADFSNFGPEVDLTGPGVGIRTVSMSDTLTSWSGTSFSAPLVSGVCSLLASFNPDLTLEEALTFLILGAEDQVGGVNDVPGFDPYFGWGRLNAYQSLWLASQNSPKLEVVLADDTDPASLGCELTYTITVANKSAGDLTGVWVTNARPAQATFVSASASQGTVVLDEGNVIFNAGTLPFRGQMSLSVVVLPTGLTPLTNSVVAVSDQTRSDPVPEPVRESTMVVVDLTGPRLVTAWARPDQNRVEITFSERVSPETAIDPANYILTDGWTNRMVITAIDLSADGTQVILESALWTTVGPFTLIADHLQDCVGNPMTASAPVTVNLPSFSLVPSGSVWKYLDDGSDPGPFWAQPLFRDQSWGEGRAQLGYGDFDEATIISYGPDPDAKHITTYFRHAFFVPNAATLTNLVVRLLRDDGGVVYLNGVEVFRSNLPAGTVTPTTPASGSVADEEETTWYASPAINPGTLVDGTNLLAVEIHQSSGTSSDVSFDLELSSELKAYYLEPSFLEHPESQTVVQGDTVTFHVTVAGTPPFGYRWRRNFGTIVHFEDGTPTLTLTNVQLTDAARYTVVVTNLANLTPGVLSNPGILTVLQDRDGDRAPDDWETAHGFDPDDPGDGDLDPDEDGSSNAEEFRAGTDPRDQESVFRVDRLTSEQGEITIEFMAVSNRSYSVQYRDSVGAGPWSFLTHIAAGPSNRVEIVTDTLGAGEAGRFYRLVTPRQR